jgi:hypothetical protein
MARAPVMDRRPASLTLYFATSRAIHNDQAPPLVHAHAAGDPSSGIRIFIDGPDMCVFQVNLDEENDFTYGSHVAHVVMAAGSRRRAKSCKAWLISAVRPSAVCSQ